MLLKLWELRGMQNVFIQIWNEAKVQIQNLYKSQMRLDMWIIKICTSRRCYEGFGTSAASRPVQRQSCSPLNSHKFSLKQLLLSAGEMIKILFQNPSISVPEQCPYFAYITSSNAAISRLILSRSVCGLQLSVQLRHWDLKTSVAALAEVLHQGFLVAFATYSQALKLKNVLSYFIYSPQFFSTCCKFSAKLLKLFPWH